MSVEEYRKEIVMNHCSQCELVLVMMMTMINVMMFTILMAIKDDRYCMSGGGAAGVNTSKEGNLGE